MKEVKLFETYPENKFQQQMLANEIILPVIEGDVNPIDVYVKAKAIQDALKIVTDDDRVKDLVICEVEKYGNNTTYNSASLQVKEMGVKYDYSVCNDSIYNDLVDNIEKLKETLKQREKFLKSISSDGTLMVDEETGEVNKIYPPIKMAAQGISVTFKK